MSRNSLTHTTVFTLSIAIACSLMVSAAVAWLRPVQERYASIDRDRRVLVAAGLIEAGADASAREVAERFEAIEVRLVDLDTGRYTDAADPREYDYLAVAESETQSVEIPRAENAARLGRRAPYMPVYVYRDEGSLERIVLPVYGRGMWSTLKGYLALESDLETVAALTFYEHGETPGIGDFVEQRDWQARWPGKQAYDEQGRPALGIARESLAPDDPARRYQTDAMSGATKTARGVTGLLQYWLGDDGYGPLLARLREEGDAS
ncbi:Na(+)-translocating NADH-quinone reductase subunit C [Lentisalinibacter orientalis]|uniref:Na(+)-translocating NADH-quinone reductase subunit C n=1 Tax=Lentisalinibacter orientalis TaxID=2992241 RepID=UPI00386E100A